MKAFDEFTLFAEKPVASSNALVRQRKKLGYISHLQGPYQSRPIMDIGLPPCTNPKSSVFSAGLVRRQRACQGWLCEALRRRKAELFGASEPKRTKTPAALLARGNRSQAPGAHVVYRSRQRRS